MMENMYASAAERKPDPASMSDRDLLIALLSRTDCRKHAEELADALFCRFRSLRRIVMSRHEKLLEVDGMTEHAAEMLCLLQNASRKNFPPPASFVNRYTGPMSGFAEQLLRCSTEEELWIAGYDEFGCLRRCECIQRGTVNSLQFNLRPIVEYASRHHLKEISLAHNHPDGSADDQSDADMSVLQILCSILGIYGISLREYITADERMTVHQFVVLPSEDALQQERRQNALNEFTYMITDPSKGKTFHHG